VELKVVWFWCYVEDGENDENDTKTWWQFNIVVYQRMVQVTVELGRERDSKCVHVFDNSVNALEVTFWMNFWRVFLVFENWSFLWDPHLKTCLDNCFWKKRKKILEIILNFFFQNIKNQSKREKSLNHSTSFYFYLLAH
jgi:hypothetical protein